MRSHKFSIIVDGKRYVLWGVKAHFDKINKSIAETGKYEGSPQFFTTDNATVLKELGYIVSCDGKKITITKNK